MNHVEQTSLGLQLASEMETCGDADADADAIRGSRSWVVENVIVRGYRLVRDGVRSVKMKMVIVQEEADWWIFVG